MFGLLLKHLREFPSLFATQTRATARTLRDQSRNNWQEIRRVGFWRFLWAVLKTHWWRAFKTFVISGGMSVGGYYLLVHSVDVWGWDERWANPLISLFMWPLGLILNWVLVWYDRQTDMFDRHEELGGGTGRWAYKTIFFVILSQGSYQVMVTLLDWNFKYVKAGQILILGPISYWVSNNWVFPIVIGKIQEHKPSIEIGLKDRILLKFKKRKT